MRVAVLADIHGNIHALEAALEDAVKMKADQLVIAGDVVVGAPDSLACWDRVKALGCPILRGNHERYVFDLDTPRAKPEWRTRQFGPVHYAAAQFTAQQRQELAGLPGMLRLDSCPDVLFVHGSARSDNDLVYPYTRDAEIEPMFVGVQERWLLRGHNHFASVRLWRDRKIVTVGSVGLPLDGTPSAQYTIIERRGGDWGVIHRSVPYDVGAAVRRFQESGYLDMAGPMARLYQREVLTASFQIVPFLRFYSDVRKNEPHVSLDEAVARFLPKNA